MAATGYTKQSCIFKRIEIQTLVNVKLNEMNNFCFERFYLWHHPFLQGIFYPQVAIEAQEYNVKTVQDQEWRH